MNTLAQRFATEVKPAPVPTDGQGEFTHTLPCAAEVDIPKTLDVDTVVRVGGPAGPFVSSPAERFTTDLIVRGCHYPTWSERLASGNTAEYIVRTAPCPMFSIPELLKRDPI